MFLWEAMPLEVLIQLGCVEALVELDDDAVSWGKVIDLLVYCLTIVPKQHIHSFKFVHAKVYAFVPRWKFWPIYFTYTTSVDSP
mgnify:CR=1 FL=1